MSEIGILLTSPRIMLSGKLQRGTIAPLKPILVKNTTNHIEKVIISSTRSNTTPYLIYNQKSVMLEPHHIAKVSVSLVIPTTASYKKGTKIKGYFLTQHDHSSVSVAQTITLESRLTSPPSIFAQFNYNSGTFMYLSTIFLLSILFALFFGFLADRRKKKKNERKTRKDEQKRRLGRLLNQN